MKVEVQLLISQASQTLVQSSAMAWVCKHCTLQWWCFQSIQAQTFLPIAMYLCVLCWPVILVTFEI